MCLKMSLGKCWSFCLGLNVRTLKYNFTVWNQSTSAAQISGYRKKPFWLWETQVENLNAIWYMPCLTQNTHFNDIMSKWARWRLKSPASRLFTQPFIQAQIKEIIKAPRHWPLCGDFNDDRWIPRTKGPWRGKCFRLMTSSCIVDAGASSLSGSEAFLSKYISCTTVSDLCPRQIIFLSHDMQCMSIFYISLHAKFFCGNINMYLYFISFFHIDMPKDIWNHSCIRPGLIYFT